MSPFESAFSPASYACAFVILACANFLASANCGNAVSNLDFSLFAKSFVAPATVPFLSADNATPLSLITL